MGLDVNSCSSQALGMIAQAIIPTCGRLKQEDLEFKASLSYMKPVSEIKYHKNET